MITAVGAEVGMRLGAPSIVGELSTCSATVRLQHQLTGSTVDIIVGGTTISLGRADWSDQRFSLPGGIVLPAGAVVRATQTLGADTSDPSEDGAVVQAVLPSLPPPIVEAPFVGCAALVVVDGLSPDSTVTVRNSAGTTIGSARAEGSRAEVGLKSAVTGGQTVHVHVTADACGTISTADSPPAEPVGVIGEQLQPPSLPVNPYACQRVLEIAGLRPGETLTMERGDGSTVQYGVTGTTMLARLDPPLLPAETISVQVEAPRRCEALPSDRIAATASAGPPPPPRISTPPCPGTPLVGLADLVPSAQVRLRRDVEELAVFEAAESSGVFDLAGITLAAGDHLVVEQALCGVWSPPSPVDTIVTMPDIGDRLAVVEPVADCATLVRVTGTAPGSLVSVLSRHAKGRIGHCLATGDAVDVTVSPPLAAGDTVEVVAAGCGGGLAIADVVAVPEAVPSIVRAMSGERAVDIGTCRIGALIDVRVAGLWAGSAVAVEREVRVFVTDVLVEGQRVEVVARWCGRSTSGDGRDVARRPDVSFLRAGDRGIDAGGGHWYSGQVKAIEPISGGRVLVGTTSSGLWLLQPGVAATSLSDTWPDTWIRCIARDPTLPGRWFAGTAASLRVTVPTALQPEVNWTVVPRAGDMSAVHDVLVLPGLGFLITATSSGVRWTQLATLGAAAFTTRAPVDTGTFWSLAMGPGESVVAYGNSRLYVGTFDPATLVWDWVDRTFATPPGGDGRMGEVATNAGFGCLSSSPADRARVYLAVEDQRDNTWFPVLRSDDGGSTWSIPSTEGIRYFKPTSDGEADRPGIDMGLQAERNLVVTAHPTQRDTVMLVGRRKGVLGSVDGAGSWDAVRWPDLSGSSQFHEDSMCLVFDPADPGGETVWAGGDGGVFRSTDLGVSWNSIGNRDLPTLMFDGGNGGTWAHTLTANPADPDVLIAGLQDNGLVYRSGAASAWTSMIGGDGRRTLFVAPDVALVVVNDATDVRLATWDGATITRGAQVVPAGLPPNSFTPILRRVCYPAYRRNGDLMVAVAAEDTIQAAQPTGRRIYGFFDNLSADVTNRFRWELLATMPFDVTGIGSWDGRDIVVATAGDPPPTGSAMTGHIYRVDSASGTVTPLTTTALAGRGGARWVDFPGPSSAVAVDDTGVVYSPDLVVWKAAPAGAVGVGVTVSTEGWSLAVDRHPFPAVVYIARGDGVFGCSDLTGSTWRQATNLPAQPLVNNAEVVVSGSRRVLHVGTWNWSAWAAELP